MSSNTSKEQRNEQVFFDDSAIDRLMGTVMSLATELFVLRNRLSALEGLMAKSGLLDIDKLLETASADEIADRKIDAMEYSEALLKPLLGLQDAVGPTE
jgi:hypothetical protein